MAVLSYVAVDRGYLVSGHSAGVAYDIDDFEVSAYDPSLVPDVSVTTSLNGTSETIYNKTERYVSFTATFLTGTELLNFEEFMTSVAGGQGFFFDPLGTLASPSAIVYNNCKLDGAPLSPQRIGVGSNSRYDIPFKIRVESV